MRKLIGVYFLISNTALPIYESVSIYILVCAPEQSDIKASLILEFTPLQKEYITLLCLI